MEEPSEVYLYVGCTENTYLFWHTISNEKHQHSIDGQLLNCLINETMVTTPDKCCIVFSLRPDSAVDVTCISHILIDNITYSTETLNNLYKLCITTLCHKTDDALVFLYKYDSKCFETYEMPMNFNVNLSDESLCVSIKYYKTAKEFILE